jgi:diacylglycerol O-acyltransferase
MHVGACMIFQGPPPDYGELIDATAARLHLVPRYRQRLAFVPFGQGRPVRVDDPHFNIGYHVRHTALPRPGDEEQLKRLAGRVFSQALDRSRPLWELWLVEGLSPGRFALISKTHHALVDRISGVDVMSVMLDPSPEPAAVAPAHADWAPRPLPTPAQLLADALIERATAPEELLGSVRAAVRHPRRAAAQMLRALGGLGALTLAGLAPAPPSPLNIRIGPHRRFAWVHAELATFKAIRDALGAAIAPPLPARAGRQTYGALADFELLVGNLREELAARARAARAPDSPDGRRAPPRAARAVA